MPWRISAKVKADPSAARLEQIEAAYGPEDSALRLTGAGDIRFGASPLLRATLSAKQLDADKFAARGNSAAEPLRLVAGIARADGRDAAGRAYSGANRVQRRAGHAGRPTVAGCRRRLQAGATSWAIDRLEFRAPGATRVTLNGSNAQAGAVSPARSASIPPIRMRW